MAYFSNGTEGEAYEERWCTRCIHYDGCPIWLLHQLKNYEECNNLGSMLHVLIPRSVDRLSNEQCTMFVDEGLLSPTARAQFKTQAQTAHRQER